MGEEEKKKTKKIEEEKEIISLLFHRKTDCGLFTFNNEKIEQYKRQEKTCKKELNNFINLKIDTEQRESLKELIDCYSFAVHEFYFWEEEGYYREGFYDCLSLVLGYLQR